MNRRAIASVSALALTAVLPIVSTPAQATTRGPSVSNGHAGAVSRSDNRATPASSRQTSQRQTAVNQLMSGEAKVQGRGANRTIVMADGSEVSYPTTQQAQLLTFLVDFGSGAGNPDFPTQTAGPVHNEIPQPGPSDNSTYWKSSFDSQHYRDMFFNGMPEQDGQSFKDSYAQMSSGRFGLSGDVSDWVSVDHPESYYSQADGSESGQDMADFVGDSATAWYDAQVTAGKSDAQIKAYLQQFDQWDRYDSDNDGVYNEPDGYIDHFQAIHAGVGEEAGGAPWTIWSHRSGAAFDPSFSTGPDCVSQNPDFDCYLPGGVEIGDTGYWIFDYTTEPENGGLGVFAHEFGHDLGLPDYYDTDSSTSDNSTGFWNLMSAGSWMSNAGHATGTTPNHMGAYDKYYLGWYGPGDQDLAVVDGLAEDAANLTLGPSYHATTTGKQAALVTLPDGSATVEGPAAGSDDGAYLYSGNRSSTDATATSPPIEVPGVDQPILSAKVAYATEPDYDYAYLQASVDDGAHWTNVDTSESTDTNPNLANLGHGITGGDGSWTDLEADLTAYAGSTIRLRWEYLTDGATLGDLGFAVDEISIGDYSTGFDTPEVDWDLASFVAVSDDEYTITFPQAYFIENRQYRGYDSTLATGPYSWGHNVSEEPYTVSDRFPYQDGLLVWYVNGRYGDNNTSQHPGGGITLPVDANPAVQQWRDDDHQPLGATDSRLQTFDSTFDVDETDGLHLDLEIGPDFTGHLSTPPHDSVPVFDDSDVENYYDSSVAGGDLLSTKVAGAGAMIQVLSSDEGTGKMRLKIGSRFAAATQRPTITGTPTYGETLTATPPAWFQDGVDVSDPTWLRDGTPIEGADGAEHEVGHADVGHTLSVSYTGTLDGYAPTTTESAGVEATVAPAPEPTTPLAIEGTPQVGQTLTAIGATWPVAGTSTFAWTVDGRPAGTGATYLVKPGDLGKKVTLTETFQSTDHADATTTTDRAAVAAGSAPAATAPPRVTGSARVGGRLTVTGATWPRAGTSTYAWSVDGKAVGTGTSYDVAPADAGKKVTVRETFTASGYAPATASAQSATIAQAKVTLRVSVGKATKGKKVTAAITALSPDLIVPGKVTITYGGKKVGAKVLKKGKVTVKLPARRKGVYRLKVSYPGAPGFGAAGKTVTVRVK